MTAALELRRALGAWAVERVDGLWVLPDSERALVEVVHILRDRRAALGRDVKLSRELLGRVDRVQQASMTAEVGAGVGLGRLEERLAQHSLSLGPLPPGAWDLPLGEFLEGSYAGLRAIPGGRLEPLCAQLDGVLADGRHVVTQPGPRSATGPDLAALFLGAHGRLGLVTRALVRAVPAMQGQASAIFSFPAVPALVDGLRCALAAGCWLSHARLEQRGSRYVAQVHWGGSVGGVERDRELLARCVEGVGGRPAGEVGSGAPRGPDREATWDALAEALSQGRTLSVYRLALASVVVRGEVQGLPLDVPTPWSQPVALPAALDPLAILGGAP